MKGQQLFDSLSRFFNPLRLTPLGSYSDISRYTSLRRKYVPSVCKSCKLGHCPESFLTVGKSRLNHPNLTHAVYMHFLVQNGAIWRYFLQFQVSDHLRPLSFKCCSIRYLCCTIRSGSNQFLFGIYAIADHSVPPFGIDDAGQEGPSFFRPQQNFHPPFFATPASC